jgi:hypothetical protein
MPACGLRAAASAMPWSSRDPLGGRPHLSEALSVDSQAVRLDAVHVRDLGLREAEDPEIFDRAREAQVVRGSSGCPTLAGSNEDDGTWTLRARF